MKKMLLVPMLAVLFLSGCVTGTRSIELAAPEYVGEKSQSGSIYIGSINDKRVFEQKPRDPSTPSVTATLNEVSEEELSRLIGRQRNGYGKAMGDVSLPEGKTVQDSMRELITTGLESRGYDVVDDANAPNKLTVDIEKFWAWFSPGMWVVSFESNLHSKVGFERSSGEKVELDVQGYGLNKGQVASNANWQLAYDRAFQDFLKNLDEALGSKGL